MPEIEGVEIVFFSEKKTELVDPERISHFFQVGVPSSHSFFLFKKTGSRGTPSFSKITTSSLVIFGENGETMIYESVQFIMRPVFQGVIGIFDTFWEQNRTWILTSHEYFYIVMVYTE